MKNLTMIFMLAVALLVSTGSAQAQKGNPPIDLSVADLYVNVSNYSPTLNFGSPDVIDTPEVTFRIWVGIEQRKEAKGVTVTAQLPEGVTPLSISDEHCTFNDNLIVCNYQQVGLAGAMLVHSAFGIDIKARPLQAGDFTLSANVTAITPDQNLANNASSKTLTVVKPVKSRKRFRAF